MVRRQKKARPLCWLLLIPGQLAVDLLGIFIAMLLDARSLPAEAGLGHPAPVWTIVAMVVLGAATLIVCGLSVVMSVVRLVQRRGNEAQTTWASGEKESTDGTNGSV